MKLNKISKAIFLASGFFAALGHASVAHLALTGTGGDWVTLGNSVDNIYSSADPLLHWNFVSFNNVGTMSAPAADHISFSFLRAPWLVADDQYATLDFSTRELGVPMTTGLTYADAERAAFASIAHPGLDVSYGHRGCNTLSGSFTLNQLSFASNQISQFSATFTQSCDGGALMHGSLFYDANLTSLPSTVPEPTTLTLLGLGIVGLGITRRRKLRTPR